MGTCGRCGMPIFDDGSWKAIALGNIEENGKLIQRLTKIQTLLNKLRYSPTKQEFSFTDIDLIISGFNSVKELMEFTNEL